MVMIPVTKPFLPPKEEYQEVVDEVWNSGWLTNSGPLVNQLEAKLAKKLKVSNLLFVANGTLALQLSIKALELQGDIITTPFSFVATTSSIVWENCNPVFVDIDKETLNIDSAKIEASITPNTAAILATHVYGNPCDVFEIERIAKKYALKVIYDGAHAFGVEVNGVSIFEFGDITICSTHATKIFHTVEGGFVVTKSNELHNTIKQMTNFGFKDALSFSRLGINTKNSEFHAAMGIVNLKYVEENFKLRKELCLTYDDLLDEFVNKPSWCSNATNSYSYYPVLFNSEKELKACQKALEKEDIYTRRYFYPLLSESLPYVSKVSLSVAEEVSKTILCLPLYRALSKVQVEKICSIIQTVLITIR
tara:strand:+ start:724 stop:1815 length:1092 start_codon:yes stop_codon:yes gene_type:complete